MYHREGFSFDVLHKAIAKCCQASEELTVSLEQACAALRALGKSFRLIGINAWRHYGDAYRAAGKPYGPKTEDLMRWIEYRYPISAMGE